jgi:hypothetical protein
MILIQRISDGEIMHDIQGNDWGKAGKLQELIEFFGSLPEPRNRETLESIERGITALQADREEWYNRRKDSVIKRHGGIRSDYQIRQVPDDQKPEAMQARYISVVNDVLSYYIDTVYDVQGSTIIVNPGWVRGNHRLLESDLTDFSGYVLTEPLFFRLVFAQSIATLEISVQLLTRNEDEEFADLPASLKRLDTICDGRLNVDNSITEGVF